MSEILPRIALPEVTLTDAPLEPAASGDVGAIAIPVHPAPDAGAPRLGGAGERIADRYGVDLLAEASARADADGVAGTSGWTRTVRLPRALAGHPPLPYEDLPAVVVLLGWGDGSPSAARRAGLCLGRAGAGLGRLALTLGDALDAEILRALVEGFLLAAYRMPRTGHSAVPGAEPARMLSLHGHVAGGADALAAARTAARATWLTRLLAATPSSTKNPEWMARQATALVSDAPMTGGRLAVEVHDEDWLDRQGMEAMLAVGGGSATPPRLVVVTWTPDRPLRSVALVGKGITYDTGGLSLKPREAMIPMKTDMAGSATVLSAVLAAADAGLPVRVSAVLPLAENALSGSAYRPGDVVRTFDGTTVEISNTDAEGRMVLADAIGWVVDTLQVDDVVDVATLTGAATLGLGRHHAALYADSDDLAAALIRAGQDAGEPAWRMPLVEDYRSALASDVADIGHAVKDPKVGGGSITAALFLQRFTRQVRWAHLDIAGVGRAGKADGELPAQAPTGFGARLLVRWLESLA
ncbi:leucyl aminopeptidase family protein [Georgenia deserti]|uniref:Probable cytosol aminopeptidase n=1 Tax=Georgenia deserti TaxID=2093781 RepID=A0ABW4L275_9MICO